ncbi:MAG: amino acid adenylation domain-containing protein, partial [Bradymonadaceae bacterium]
HDWEETSGAEWERRFRALADRRQRDGLDLQSAPLLQLDLVRVSDGNSRLLITVHHIITDGWSSNLVTEEFLENLSTLRRGEALPSRPAPPYREYIGWIDEQQDERAEAFWRQQLEGVKPTRLPEGRAETDGESAQYETVERALGQRLGEQVRELARDSGVAENIVFQAAWALLLARYGDALEVTYGLTLSGRAADLGGMESRVGMFINTVPMRVDTTAATSLEPWLRQLQDIQADVRKFGHCSPFQIREWADLPADMDLMEAIFVFQNHPDERSVRERFDDLCIRGVESREHTHNPLTFVVAGRRVGVHYEASRFRGETIATLVDEYETLLSSFVDAPERPPLQHRRYGDEQRARLVDEWARGPDRERGGEPVHRQFERRADEHPERVALRFDGGEWTYGQLDRRSNRLAHRLRAFGVGPDVPVGVSMRRSPELVAAFLGVWKAGGAYVAMPPELPERRLSYMAADAGLDIVVCDEAGREATAWNDCKLVDFETGSNASAEATSPVLEVGEPHLAYVMYTSGTTGRPKGVMVAHRGVSNYVDWCSTYYPMGKDRTVPLFLNVAFDLAVTVLWGPLVSGGDIDVVAGGSGVEALEAMVERGETGYGLVKATPTHLQLFEERLEESQREEFASAWVLGGEQLTGAHLEGWPEIEAYNEYGPTETVVGSTVEAVEGEAVEERADQIAIGEPIENVATFVLTPDLSVSPPGVEGHLHIAGDGVARGYRGKPRRTATAFVPDPFSDRAGGRMYRTGDVARWTDRGHLEYRGRNDEQVQVRGVRVEIGAIEAHLEGAPGVRRGAVRPLDERDGRAEELVGYVVPESEDGEAKPEAIREHLSERLTREVVPGRYVEYYLGNGPSLAETPLDRLDGEYSLAMKMINDI